jgi:hypothetical protein
MTTIPVSLQMRGRKIETWKVVVFSTLPLLALASKDYHKSLISVIPATALLFVYTALIPRRKTSINASPLIIDENLLKIFSSRVVVLLLIGVGIQSCLFGFSLSNLVAAIAPGYGKALSWVFLIRTVSLRSASSSIFTRKSF